MNQPVQRPLANGSTLAVVLFLCVGPGSSGADPSSPPDSVLPCVPCHSSVDNDQVGEWLASPYNEPEGGRGCTDCHASRCSENGQGPSGSRSPNRAARLTVVTVCSPAAVEAEVAVSNVGAGHRMPTGPGERALILEVAAFDRDREPLPVWAERRLPATWTVAGFPSPVRVGDGPSDRYVTLEPRLPPFATHVSRYRFIPPASGPARVSARLVLATPNRPPLEIAGTVTECKPSEEQP